MKRVDDLPIFCVDQRRFTRCSHNPLGVKRRDAAGAAGSLPLNVNAVVDALTASGYNVVQIDLPLSPARAWAAKRN